MPPAHSAAWRLYLRRIQELGVTPPTVKNCTLRNQARRVANFLLAWHNAEENGGWDPVDLWNVDAAIADDIQTVVRLIRESHRYPNDLGFSDEIAAVWRLWRQGPSSATADRPAVR
jgi:hypothetical protein